MSYIKYFLVFVITLMFAAGCASMKNWECSNIKCWQKGAVAGMAAGAATGAIIGHQSEEDGEGAAIGAATGMVIGGIMGKLLCKDDSDHDGISDNIDQCPGTPKGVRVDSRGCPLDSDKDGVPDYLDQCPGTPEGVKVDARGCPPVKEKLIILQGIKFGFGNAEIKKDSEGILDNAVKILTENREIKVRVEGHTCSIGSDEYNLKLSRKRALAVKNYLISRGISGERMQTVGKGEKFPISSNETAEGRKQNRRIEFIIIEK